MTNGFDTSVADFAISATVTAVSVQGVGSSPSVDFSNFLFRTTTIFASSQLLTLIDLPIDTDINTNSLGDVTSLQLDEMVLGLSINQPVALTGENAGLPGVNAAEILVISDIEHAGGHTTLTFQNPLQNSYTRSTAAFNANVVAATHGQTVGQQVTPAALAQLAGGISAAQALGLPVSITAGGAPVEVLGSGDATVANQTFLLSANRPSLTFPRHSPAAYKAL